MTNSEHAALSAELARALGWKLVPSVFRLERGVPVIDPAFPLGDFRWFDYRAPDVCLPLIEWLMSVHDCELRMYGVVYHVQRYSSIGISRSLPEAVARAVIAVKGK